MAATVHRPNPPRPGRIGAGVLLASVVAGLIGLVLVLILLAAGDAGLAPARIDLPHLLRMSAIQAGLSTALSLLAGMVLAWCLDRLDFPGRGLVVALFAAAIVTPGIVVAFGLLSVWGRNGWINALSDLVFGMRPGNLAFGLGGILIAHVVLNGAFAARVLLARLDAVPEARLKLGQSLGLGPLARIRHVDWPAMRGALPGLGAVIFLLTFTSFPIVLMLGGGPANQTLEVAIYTAVRLDFDLRGAVLLALAQIGVCALVIAFSSSLAPVPTGIDRPGKRLWRDPAPLRLVQWLALGLFGLGFAAPLVAVLLDGLGPGLAGVLANPAFWRASLTSLLIGALSAALTLLLALGLGMARAAVTSPALRIGLSLPVHAYLAVPAVVLSLGFFLLVRALGVAPSAAAPAVVVIANALLALPFAVATLGPALDAVARTRGKLIRTLGLGGWRQFAEIEYPLLGRDIGVALALAFCFSLGDLGVIALFGTQDFETLPLMMYRALGAYRTNDAAVIAGLLLLGSVLAFAGLPKLFERLAHARR